MEVGAQRLRLPLVPRAVEKDYMSLQRWRQNKEEQLIKKINTDTGFDSICAVCCEFKSKASTVSLDILTKSEIEKHAWRIEQNREINGSFSVCDLCRKAIKKSEAPPKKPQHNPQLTDFPKTLLNSVVKISGSESPRLNKLEGFLLKLVIPFSSWQQHTTHTRTVTLSGTSLLRL